MKAVPTGNLTNEILTSLGIEDSNLGGFCGEWMGSGPELEVMSATTHLDEALLLAREVEDAEIALVASVRRALLPDGNVKSALAALAEYEPRASNSVHKMEARFGVWRLTKDWAHLEEAHRLLCYLRDHAPEDCRDSMIENVPLHRDIMKAWEEHGGP